MRFMIGGCSAAGSFDSNCTLSPAGLFALLGFTSALNVTVDRGECRRSQQGHEAPDAEHGY